MVRRSVFGIVALLALSACAGASGLRPAPTSAGARGTSSALLASSRAKLIFHDEFDGTSLDRSIWYRCYNWANARTGCKTAPGELEVYRPDNVRVANGKLLLTARVQRTRYLGKETWRRYFVTKTKWTCRA